MVSSSPTKLKKEFRKLRIEVEIKDKTGQTFKLIKEEEVEFEYPVLSTTFDVGRRHFPGRKKIIQIDKDGKKYDLLLEGEVKKGLFKDDPRAITTKSMSDDFEIISQKII